jgi:small subunit ribosomal protein S6
MLDYELMAIFSSELEEKHLESAKKKIEDAITKNKGKLVKTDDWGRRRLAYPINHEQEGIYNIFYFQGDPKKINKINYAIRIMDEVIRFGLYRVPGKVKA